MLMSHLQENIQNADINTQVLYNRTLVQVGLCAFRAGLTYDAQTALQEICSTGKLKELLAQGIQMRYNQTSPEQERLERQRQLPFHMHINLELLECTYLTCSMLIEIPNYAQAGSNPEVKRRIISKSFKRMLDYNEKQVFTGPPENTRDHVMMAAKALAAGDWQKSIEFIHAIKIWELMPLPDKIKAMLAEKIQEEGLRTYLFTYSPFYDTVSLARLADMFELPPRRIGALVSRMIAHDEIHAALDQVNDAIVFRKGVELTRLQTVAYSLSEKAAVLIENNEKAFEQKTSGGALGGEGGQGDRQRGRGGGDKRGGDRGDRGDRKDGQERREGGGSGRGRGRGRGGNLFQSRGGSAVRVQ